MKRALAVTALLIVLALVALWVISSRDRESGEAPARLVQTIDRGAGESFSLWQFQP